jgi:hypothetical protein
MGVVHVKGTALIATVRFVQETLPANALPEILRALDPDDRGQIDAGVLVSAWYPFSLLIRLMRQVGRFDAGRTPHLYRLMGRASAEYSLTTIYRIFFKIGSPQYTLSKAARVFGSYYDSGTMEAIVNEKGHAILELRDFTEPAPEFCDRLWGWCEKTIELISSHRLHRAAHIQCVNRGDPTCQFEGFWEQ